MTLYELTDQMYSLLQKMEEIPPEDPEERETWEAAIHDTLAMLVDDFAEKAEGYGQVMKQLQADAEAVKAEKMRLVKILKGMAFPISDYAPFQFAIVTAGGVACDEVNKYTMESLKVKGLYFAGEVLDLDANTGGYNMQIAFSTGRLAGQLKK